MEEYQLTNSGIYFDTVLNTSGCDSIQTLLLSFLPSPTTILSQRICSGDSVIFHGKVLKSTGVYTDTFKTWLGCDSLVKLNLTVKIEFLDTLELSLCAGDSSSIR